MENCCLGLNVTEAVIIVVGLAAGHVMRVAVAGIQSELKRKRYQIVGALNESAARIEGEISYRASVKLVTLNVVLVQF